jgi:hypothetical protein
MGGPTPEKPKSFGKEPTEHFSAKIGSFREIVAVPIRMATQARRPPFGYESRR